MPVRVELIDEAVEDLIRYAETGNLPLFLKKLLRLEEVGKDVGLLLGRGLTGWRKIVVGDRNWRIIFTINLEETVATVWVIGDRDDAACYQADLGASRRWGGRIRRRPVSLPSCSSSPRRGRPPGRGRGAGDQALPRVHRLARPPRLLCLHAWSSSPGRANVRTAPANRHR